MHALKAHVRNGYLVSDEPTELPEGAAVEIQLTKVDSFAAMEPSERAELEAAIEEGYEDIERGDVEDARAYAERLLAKK